jgi:hypothetical protein
LAASLLIYFAISLSQHAYGWLTLLDSLVKPAAFPSAIVPPHDVRVYLPLYLQALWRLLRSPHFLIYLVAGYLLAVFRRNIWTRALHTPVLLAIPACFAVLHLALYPWFEERYFVLPVTLILVWILGSLRSISASLAKQSVIDR